MAPWTQEDEERYQAIRQGRLSSAAAHHRARKVLPLACSLADATCSGRLEAAFRHDAPEGLVRRDGDHGPYYVGPNSAEGYWRLCQAHHRRYDARLAA